MVELQNKEEVIKDKLLDQLENLYEKSRDISHEPSEDASLEFYKKISLMLSSYSSEEIKVIIIGNTEHLWTNISEKKKKELFYVLQELMVNMKKHSFANLVAIKFEKNLENLFIKYTDNGVGIQDLEKKTGTGLRNTGTRIATIDGVINFEKNPKGGLIVTLNIPI